MPTDVDENIAFGKREHGYTSHKSMSSSGDHPPFLKSEFK